MGHEHVSKVLEFNFDDDFNWKPSLYGCTGCDETSLTSFKSSDVFVDHNNCGPDCFGCKARGLQMNTGDANSQRNAPRKRFESELSAYANAKAQGIQPGGTSMEKIREAEAASEVLNKPYNANSMPDAKNINQSTAAVMKEIGQA
jgi:hypothetical protein